MFRTLKILISCDICKNPMPFLRLYFLVFINFRNFNKFINKPIPFEYEPIQIFEEEDDVFDNEDYNKDLRCDEINKTRDILDYHKDAIEKILETYENDLENTIHRYYFNEQKLYDGLKAIYQSMSNKVKSFIEMLFSQHDIKDSVLSVDTGITYRRWDYPGEVIIDCIIYI